MEYVNLGSTGLKVSRLCLGTMTYGSASWRKWVLEEEASRPFIRKALELGINFIDTANMYSDGRSEEILGRALKDFGPSRDRVVIGTKVCMPMGDDPNQRGLSRKHIFHSIDNSLRRLRTDYVDLYQIHRFDDQTPVEETMRALEDLVRAGKVLYVGASSMMAWQFAKMLYVADQLGAPRFVCMQNHYNVVYREEEREMMPLCVGEEHRRYPVQPSSSRVSSPGTGRGKVPATRSGRRWTSIPNSSTLNLMTSPSCEQVTRVAQARGVSNAQVALAWLMHQPGVVAPIVGATDLNHLKDSVGCDRVKAG